MKQLTVQRLKELLSYDRNTGKFIRLKTRGPYVAGSVAGTVSDLGYRSIFIDGRIYKEHRLVWLYITDKWPAWEIDHINRDPSDNRIENLREATPSQNMPNRPA